MVVWVASLESVLLDKHQLTVHQTRTGHETTGRGEKVKKRHDQTGELDGGTPTRQGGVDVWEGACPWREGRVEEGGGEGVCARERRRQRGSTIWLAQ